MTVQELINKLESLEDKGRDVVFKKYDSEWGHIDVIGVEYILQYDGYYELKGSLIKTIHDNNNYNSAEFIDKDGNITYY